MSDIRVQPDDAVRLTQLEADLAELQDTIKLLSVEVAQLSQSGGQPAASQPQPGHVVTPPTWSQSATVEEKDALVDWVDWLLAAYAPRQEERLTPCWTQHEGVVEELAALRRSWVAAYLDTTNPKAIGQWHVELANAFKRISSNWRLSLCIDRHVER